MFDIKIIKNNYFILYFEFSINIQNEFYTNVLHLDNIYHNFAL